MKYLLSIFIALMLYPNDSLLSQPSEEIRQRIEWIERNDDLIIEGVPVLAKNSVKEFYYDRIFEPAWTRESAAELLSVISKADSEGLRAEDYFYNNLKRLLQKQVEKKVNPADVDILLTQAFLLYGSHLLHGKVDPHIFDALWKVKKEEKNLVLILKEAIADSKVKYTLENLAPKLQIYMRLKEYLQQYRQMQDNYNFSSLPIGKTIDPDTKDDRIPQIRQRLLIYGDLRNKEVQEEIVYEEALVFAVKQFQQRYGLSPDGKIGPNTISALNISLEEKIKKVLINMERCRWVNQDLGQKYILVNIPAFQLRYVVRKEPVIFMDVVVGKRYRQTPVFSSTMTYMVFNPYWFVPPTILRQDIIPAVKKNPEHLDNLNIKVLSGGSKIIPSSEIDWKEISATSFPYTLRQDPGPNNVLGVVKFMFPNEYHVYLHDTNNRDVFIKQDRDLSSGCIRVSQPLELARLILSGQDDWSMEKIEEVISKKQNYTVKIKEPVTVHLQYWTAFTDNNGLINFRRDIYERDEKVWKALMQ
jgi:murein L,D-transpeptidase YcbB/YkuD